MTTTPVETAITLNVIQRNRITKITNLKKMIKSLKMITTKDLPSFAQKWHFQPTLFCNKVLDEYRAEFDG